MDGNILIILIIQLTYGDISHEHSIISKRKEPQAFNCVISWLSLEAELTIYNWSEPQALLQMKHYTKRH